MSNYEKIEKIEKRKIKIWKKKTELHREIDRLNTEFEKCNNEILMLLNKSGSCSE